MNQSTVGTNHNQEIVIENVDLTATHAGDTQAQLINHLISEGKLKVDQ